MTAICDHCGVDLHKDTNGFYVGPDETSDCDKHPDGHMYGGYIA